MQQVARSRQNPADLPTAVLNSPRWSGARVSAGLAVVQIVLAYEWLISGLNKIFNPNFTVQLASTLQQSISGNPYGFYVGFLKTIVLPNTSLFGLLTELGETAIGFILAISALVWLYRPASRAAGLASAAAASALLGAAFLSLNYFFQGGSPLPWINPGNAFSEGVDIDILIPLLSCILLAVNLSAALAILQRKSEPVRGPLGERSWTA